MKRPWIFKYDYKLGILLLFFNGLVATITAIAFNSYLDLVPGVGSLFGFGFILKKWNDHIRWEEV